MNQLDEPSESTKVEVFPFFWLVALICVIGLSVLAPLEVYTIKTNDVERYAEVLVKDVGVVIAPFRALGRTEHPECHRCYAILKTGSIVVGFGEGQKIIDNKGPEVRVFALDETYNKKSPHPSYYEVFVSEDNEEWASIGLGKGVSNFDLADSHLTQARLIKVQAKGSSLYKANRNPGVRIDAIAILKQQ